MESVLVDLARAWKRAFAANKTGGFTAKLPQLAEPVNDGVVDLSRAGVCVPTRVKVTAVGVGANNDALSVRVWGWQKVLGGGDHPNGGTTANLWVPIRLAELSFTYSSTLVGVAGGIVPATEMIADTVTIVATGEGTFTANTTRDGNVLLYSPTGDLAAALAIVPINGFDKIEFDTDDTTNNPTMNVLYGLL